MEREEPDVPLDEALELETVYREINDEQAAILRLRKSLGRLITEEAFREFPSLKDMTAEQIRNFGEAITSAAERIAMKIANVAYEAEQNV